MSFRVKLRVKSLKGTPRLLPALPLPPTPASCPKCGIAFTDALGRPISLGYACSRAGCPCGFGGSVSISADPRKTFLWDWVVQ